MAERRRPGNPGPIDDGNGGPVTPDGGLAPAGAPGAGGNGLTAQPAVREPAGGDLLAPESTEAPVRIKRTRVSGLWVGITLSAVVLLFLLIFIVQNLEPARIRFLGAEGSLPVGVALLFASALGVLLVAIPGYLRILQLRRLARKREPRGSR